MPRQSKKLLSNDRLQHGMHRWLNGLELSIRIVKIGASWSPVKRNSSNRFAKPSSTSSGRNDERVAPPGANVAIAVTIAISRMWMKSSKVSDDARSAHSNPYIRVKYY